MIFLLLNKSKTVNVFLLLYISKFADRSANYSNLNWGFLLTLAILFNAFNAFYLSKRYKYLGLSTMSNSPKDNVTQGIAKK